jgi:hypothetical protein
MISESMVRLVQNVQLSCTNTNTISKQTEMRFYVTHQGVPPGASKTISEAMVHLVQSKHLSCTDTNTSSKWIEMRFHKADIT